MKDAREYFKDEASYYEFYLLHMSGSARTEALGIHEGLYTDKAAAKAWAVGLLGKIGMNWEAVGEISRLYERMTGDWFGKVFEEVFGEEAEEEDAEEEAKETEPKKFETGWEAAVVFAEDGRKIEKQVLRVTKCFVWVSMDSSGTEVVKKKIRRDADGNEYVEVNYGQETIKVFAA